jgi:hypothetical protein
MTIWRTPLIFEILLAVVSLASFIMDVLIPSVCELLVEFAPKSRSVMLRAFVMVTLIIGCVIGVILILVGK